MRRVTAVVAALAFVLAACGDDDDGGSGGGERSGPDVEAVGEQLGCDPLEEDTAKGRDDWLAIAEDFGAVVLDEGDDWVLVEP